VRTSFTRETAQRSDAIVRRHQELARHLHSGAADPFVSGWRTAHPFEAEYSGIEGIRRDLPPGDYRVISDDPLLADRISSFHDARDGVRYGRDEIVSTPGSSPLILGLLLALKERGWRQLHYIPPLFFTFHYFARMLDLTLTPVLSRPLTRRFLPALRLPDEPSVLILSDPVWALGVNIEDPYYGEIHDWQRRTRSLVVVDGTFQYLQWPDDGVEKSAKFDRDSTIRIICPTKSLCVHGVRFAYGLAPPDFRQTLRYATAQISGASGEFNIMAATAMMDTLLSPTGNRDLVEYIAERRRDLQEWLYTDLAEEPHASYYVFAKVRPELAARVTVMDQGFFGLSGLPGYSRINLLVPPAEIQAVRPAAA
jgi:aspartate/methionine/tyrosine aminotransferase